MSTSNVPLQPEHALTKFAARLIRRKARKLAYRPGFSRSDWEDIEQDLRLVLLTRLKNFDPAISHYNAFVTTVVERYVATILKHRAAESRSFLRVGGSLSTLVVDGDGHSVATGALLTEDQHTHRTGTRFRSREDLQSVASDVADVLAVLPLDVADLCERLKRDSVTTVARDLGISRTTLVERLRRIRPRFEESEMREYL